MEVYELLKEKYKKDNSANVRVLERQVRSDIESVLSEYLHEGDDVLLFEVKPQAIDVIVWLVDELSFSLKYDVVQVEPYLFEARLKTLDMEV